MEKYFYFQIFTITYLDKYMYFTFGEKYSHDSCLGSVVFDTEILQIVACQALLSMGFSRQD